MNTGNAIESLYAMQSAATQLTEDMDSYFAKHGAGLEAPEFMDEPFLSEWNDMYRNRKRIYDYQARIDSIVNDFARFHFQELA